MSNTRQLTICFYGSSGFDLVTENKLDALLREIFAKVISLCKARDISILRIVTGGYQGAMKCVIEIAKEFREHGILVRTLGITCDVYPDPVYQGSSDEINIDNDRIIMSEDIGERIQMMIELSDLFFILPGNNGTIHELLQTNETLHYAADYIKKNSQWTKKIIYDDEYYFELLRVHKFSKPYFKRFDQNDNFLPLRQLFLDENKNYNPLKIFEHENPIDKIKPRKVAKKITSFGDERLEQLKEEINSCIFKRKDKSLKGNKEQQVILSVDIAYLRTEESAKESFGKFASLSTKEYSDALSEFLKAYNSIIYSSDNEAKSKPFWAVIENASEGVIFANELISSYGKLYPKNKKKQKGDFSNWCAFLQTLNIGRTAYWKTKNVKFAEGTSGFINISIFILFDLSIPTLLRRKIDLIIDDFIYDYSIEYIQEEFNKTIKEKNIKSSLAALSQVFARNQSHNIGSHSLVKMSSSDQLCKLLEKIDDVTKQQYITHPTLSTTI